MARRDYRTCGRRLMSVVLGGTGRGGGRGGQSALRALNSAVVGKALDWQIVAVPWSLVL